MKTSDFYFDLPEELIAQTPLERRDASRLLCLDRWSGAREHRIFSELPELLHPGDCLVMNDSRVLPARLMGMRETGGVVEVLLLRDLGGGRWECLTRPGRKTRPGTRLIFGNGELEAEVLEVAEGGNRIVEFKYEGIFLEVLERLGKMPLPPYIKVGTGGRRALPDRLFQGTGQRSRADSGPAFHKGTAGEDSGQGSARVLCDAACGTRDLPTGQGGGHRGTRDALGILHNAGGDGEDHNGDEEVGRPRRLRRHDLVQDGRELCERGRDDGCKVRLDKYLYLSGLSF